MRLWKKTIIITTLLVVLFSVWYFWNQDKKAKVEEENKAKMVYSVKLWNIKTEVKVTATANLADEQNLSFWREWKITNVYVKIWDEIKAWKILAELSMDDYQNAIQTSQLELENARLWLTKLLNNDTSLRESQINSQINESKSSYDIEIKQKEVLMKQFETIIQQKNDQLEQLSRDYNLAKKNLEIVKSWLDVSTSVETEQTENTLIARKQTINSIINSLESSLWNIETVVESVDKIFGVSDNFKNNDNWYSNYLSAKDKNLKNITKSNIIDSYNLIKDYTWEIKIINSEMSDNQIYTIIQDYYNDSKIIVDLCDNALDAIDMSIESFGSLNSSTLDWFKSTVSISRTTALSIRSELEALSTSINTLLSDSSQKDQLKVSIEQKELDYERLKTTLTTKEANIRLLFSEKQNLKNDHKNQLSRKESQIDNISEGIVLLKKELNDLLDWADEYDIKQQQNLIRQAELRLERTRDAKDDYQVIAEFDWRVRTVDIAEWEQYKLDDRKYMVIENPNLIELELQVSQIDIVKVKEKDPVIVTFDSYPNSPIEATVSNRNVNPEPNGRWWIYYKVNIILEKQELEILAGMSAFVAITTDEAKEVLVIPSLALVQEWEKQFVYIKDWETYKKHEIKTGIINNFQAEVVEWLKEWDIIKSSVLDEKALKEMWIDDDASIF